MKLTGPTLWLLAGLLLVVLLMTWLLDPLQAGPVMLKYLLVFSGGVLGYFLGVLLFPYARPGGYLSCKVNERYFPARPNANNADFPINAGYHKVFTGAMLRRAMIVCCAMLAIGLGA